jgi:hypothetical protein
MEDPHGDKTQKKCSRGIPGFDCILVVVSMFVAGACTGAGRERQ